MRIGIFPRYTDLGASSRLRIYQYIPYLREHGAEVVIMPLFGESYLHKLYTKNKRAITNAVISYSKRLLQLTRLKTFDLLWIEKELFPMLPGLVEYLLRAGGIPYVVDYDDAIFHNYDMCPNSVVRRLFGKKIDKVISKSVLVIAGNDYIAKRAQDAGAEWVEVLPTVVDLKRYPVASHKTSSNFTIGWIGTPVTVKYLKLIQPALERICQQTQASLKLVGSGPVKLGSIPCKICSWSESTEVNNIKSFDVGIMPLPDEYWERGKCGYKLIQYMSCEKPVVASPVGINKRIIAHGINGFLAETQQEWYRSLMFFQSRPLERRRMGIKGRRFVEKKYCLDVTAPKLFLWLSLACKMREKN